MSTERFDPRPYLIKISGGADYLQVRDRIRWLRSEHPDAKMETHHHVITDKHAVFQASVTLPNGGSATGWGSETFSDFRDYIEKAESKALGRALAALGFGTQFCADYDTGITEDGRARIVDNPVAMPSHVHGNSSTTTVNDSKPPSPQSFARLYVLASKLGLTNPDLHALAFSRYGVKSLKDLTGPQRKAFEDALANVSRTDATQHATVLRHELQMELDAAHEALDPVQEPVNQETGEITTGPDAELVNFRERFEMARTPQDFDEIFTEAGTREPYWLQMIHVTTDVKRLERLSTKGAEMSAWTPALAQAYANRHEAITDRDEQGR